MITSEIVNEVAIELVTKNIEVVVDEHYSSPATAKPSETSTGLSINTVAQYIEFSLKDDLNKYTCWLEPDTIDGAGTYRVTVNGNNYTGSGTTAKEIIQDIVDTYASALANVTMELDEETISGVSTPRLKVYGSGITTVAASIPSGTGTWLKYAEAETAKASIYLKFRRWCKIDGLDYFDLDEDGKVFRLTSGGASNLYVRVYDITGDGTMFSGFTYIVRVAVGESVV